jgi:hypothetical protein
MTPGSMHILSMQGLCTGIRRCVNIISNGQKIMSNIYNNNKASNAKIGQNVNKVVYFFAHFLAPLCELLPSLDLCRPSVNF